MLKETLHFLNYKLIRNIIQFLNHERPTSNQQEKQYSRVLNLASCRTIIKASRGKHCTTHYWSCNCQQIKKHFYESPPTNVTSSSQFFLCTHTQMLVIQYPHGYGIGFPHIRPRFETIITLQIIVIISNPPPFLNNNFFFLNAHKLKRKMETTTL